MLYCPLGLVLYCLASGPVIEVDLDDEEAAAVFEAGAAPIAITEDEASDNDEVEFVGESRAVGANWVLRRDHGPRLDQRALQVGYEATTTTTRLFLLLSSCRHWTVILALTTTTTTFLILLSWR